MCLFVIVYTRACGTLRTETNVAISIQQQRTANTKSTIRTEYTEEGGGERRHEDYLDTAGTIYTNRYIETTQLEKKRQSLSALHTIDYSHNTMMLVMFNRMGKRL